MIRKRHESFKIHRVKTQRFHSVMRYFCASLWIRNEIVAFSPVYDEAIRTVFEFGFILLYLGKRCSVNARPIRYDFVPFSLETISCKEVYRDVGFNFFLYRDFRICSKIIGIRDFRSNNYRESFILRPIGLRTRHQLCWKSGGEQGGK